MNNELDELKYNEMPQIKILSFNGIKEIHMSVFLTMELG